VAFVALGHEKPCDALQQGFFVAFFIRAKDCAYKQKNAQKDGPEHAQRPRKRVNRPDVVSQDRLFKSAWTRQLFLQVPNGSQKA
jgi:hypothetical protein